MPGGRLTQQERQQIALGLADSLPYAEIARRLDRPTSTITREVMRNGGPTAYRADLAHRATERRAHRRRPAAPRGPESPRSRTGATPRPWREYEETFTTVLMASGLTKMTARVLTCLFTTDAGSLTASELAQRLQVSPASVSKAIAFLEGQSLVRRERDERRRDRYVVDDELFYQSTIASARANAQLVETARQGVAVLGPGHPGRRPPGEHRPLPRLHQRKHHPRRRTGPRSPPHQTRNDPGRHRPTGPGPRIGGPGPPTAKVTICSGSSDLGPDACGSTSSARHPAGRIPRARSTGARDPAWSQSAGTAKGSAAPPLSTAAIRRRSVKAAPGSRVTFRWPIAPVPAGVRGESARPRTGVRRLAVRARHADPRRRRARSRRGSPR